MQRKASIHLDDSINYFELIPDEITLHIFSFIRPEEFNKIYYLFEAKKYKNKYWDNVIGTKQFWKNKLEKHFDPSMQRSQVKPSRIMEVVTQDKFLHMNKAYFEKVSEAYQSRFYPEAQPTAIIQDKVQKARINKLFSFVKEEDLQSIKELKWETEDLRTRNLILLGLTE